MNFLELLRDINPADLCPECEVIRSARSRHCAICNECVDRFDHHCPWINNCVGIKNHNAFLMFLLSIWLKIVFHLGVDIFSIVNVILNKEAISCVDKECNDYCFNGWCTNPYAAIGCAAVCIVICLFYLLLSSVLLFTHCKNFMANRTTNERFAKKNHHHNDDEDQNETGMTSSVMSLSDFDISSLMNSITEED